VPADAKAQLDANFGADKMGEMSSALINDNASFTLSLGGLKPGKYEFNCTPHLAMNMKGTLTIEP
jgi:plastocyanin